MVFAGGVMFQTYRTLRPREWHWRMQRSGHVIRFCSRNIALLLTLRAVLGQRTGCVDLLAHVVQRVRHLCGAARGGLCALTKIEEHSGTHNQLCSVLQMNSVAWPPFRFASATGVPVCPRVRSPTRRCFRSPSFSKGAAILI